MSSPIISPAALEPLYAPHEEPNFHRELKSPRGTKTEFIREAVNSFKVPFTLSELERKCPQISRDMIRKVLREMQKKDFVECLGRGPGALWQRKGITLKRG